MQLWLMKLWLMSYEVLRCSEVVDLMLQIY